MTTQHHNVWRDLEGKCAEDCLACENEKLQARIKELTERIEELETLHPSEWEMKGCIEAKLLADRYRRGLGEMAEELSHYPEGDGIFGHLKRILRKALTIEEKAND